MGVNLVPIVRNFSIATGTFASSSHDISDGCVTAGTHRVIRFDFLTHKDSAPGSELATHEASDRVQLGGLIRTLWIPSIVLFGLLVLAHSVHAQGTPRIGGGDDFTCALGPSGRVFCWGSNATGQIGNGAGMASPVTFEPRPVEMAGGFKTIASGLFHSCGLQLDGAAYCWGHNGYGEL